MQQQPDYDNMTRDELVRELMESRQEIGNLRNIIMNRQDTEQRRRSSSGGSGSGSKRSGDVRGEVIDTSRRYGLSMNVLMVGGSYDQRSVRTISLQDVLSKSFTREDQREADTPVYFNNNNDGRLSMDMGRASEFSIGSLDSPERQMDPSDWSRQSTEVANAFAENESFDRPNFTKPAPLLQLPKGKLRLDPDAIVSHHTLLNFTREFGGRPLSPESSVATSVFKYLTQFFAKKNNFEHMQADKEPFGRSFLSLCGEVETLLKSEVRHATIESPCYVFGDIHGNMRDLLYFGENIINFQDFRFTPYNLLFLGDYVDRGECSIEVVAYLFALKVLAPEKVTLLRGNHEDTLVNGDVRTYGDTSLRGQCISIFSNLMGEEVWKRCNRVFSWLPLSANIDRRIFCTHGGLPRYNGGPDNRLEMLKSDGMPLMESFFQIPEMEDPQHAAFRQLASDVCWSDPAEDERMVNEFGFGNNPRGQGVILFGNKAVDTFLERFGFEYIFRAHQEKSDGLKLSKNARVMTIFSTSAYVGHSNGAGVVFVNDDKIRLIIKQADDDDEC